MGIKQVPELGDTSCTGCLFAQASGTNNTPPIRCTADFGTECGDGNTIYINATPEAAEQYMLLRTKIRLGIG